MSLYEEVDWLESEIDEHGLDDKERTGYLTLPAFAVFADLAEIGQVEDYAPKWQLTFRLPKSADSGRGFTWGSLLIAVSTLIGEKTWKKDSEEKLDAVWGCVEQGIAPKQSNISIQDGDLHKPEYNAGHWLVKCSRRLDEGQPMCVDTKGNPIFDKGGDVIGDVSEVVRPGDYCMVLLRVWAQKKRERINFTLIGARLVSRGAGAKAINAAQNDEAVKSLMGSALPALPAGMEPEEEATEAPTPTNKPAKKAAAKKSSAKKSSAKKGPNKKKKGSVFRKRGK
jgi:hypothetical protein